MIKVLNLLIPFLMEMVFGKKEDLVKLSAKARFKRWVFLSLIVLSLVLNYYTIEKIATISVRYIALSKENKTLTEELSESNKTILHQQTVESLLQSCLNVPVNRHR